MTHGPEGGGEQLKKPNPLTTQKLGYLSTAIAHGLPVSAELMEVSLEGKIASAMNRYKRVWGEQVPDFNTLLSPEQKENLSRALEELGEDAVVVVSRELHGNTLYDMHNMSTKRELGLVYASDFICTQVLYSVLRDTYKKSSHGKDNNWIISVIESPESASSNEIVDHAAENPGGSPSLTAIAEMVLESRGRGESIFDGKEKELCCREVSKSHGLAVRVNIDIYKDIDRWVSVFPEVNSMDDDALSKFIAFRIVVHRLDHTGTPYNPNPLSIHDYVILRSHEERIEAKT